LIGLNIKLHNYKRYNFRVYQILLADDELWDGRSISWSISL